MREGDEFIAWLDAQLVSGASPSGAEGGGSDTGGAEDHAEERARLERFLADAAARLNALVVDKRETVFRDRGGGTVSAAKASEAAEAQQSLPPELPEEELYEVGLACAGLRSSHALRCVALPVGAALYSRWHHIMRYPLPRYRGQPRYSWWSAAERLPPVNDPNQPTPTPTTPSTLYGVCH